MTNLEIAAVLYEIAELLQFMGDDAFKPRAYRRAAAAVQRIPAPVADLSRAGRLREVPSIGQAIAAKVTELVRTGRLGYLEELRRAVPPGVQALTRVPGVGGRTAMLLFRDLGIRDLDGLELAAREGRLRGVPGLGPKKESAILAALERLQQQGDWVLLGAVRALAVTLAEHLRTHPAVVQAEVAGSIRRWRELVTDIDIAVATGQPEAVLDYVTGLTIAGEVTERASDRVRMATSLGRAVEVVTAPPEGFGTLLVALTGSAAHLADLTDRGSPLTGGLPAAPTEADLYSALGLPWLPPELREGRGEVEAARAGRLPSLVELGQIRGDLHCHTTASDGTASLLEMAEAARALGHSYIAICDHSRSLAIARGLTPQRLALQAEEIRELNRRWTDFRLLRGSEVDILKDGSLDFPDEVLAELDVVVASIHSQMHLSEAEQTARLLRAIRNPHVDIIGHPTGRVLLRREPYALDLDRVIAACAETGTALEISASPARLDLRDEHTRLARERGVMLVINTDAHSVHELGLLPYGVGQARRGWVERSGILNTLGLPDLLTWLARPKGGRAVEA